MRRAIVVTASEPTGARLARVAGRCGWTVETMDSLGAALARLQVAHDAPHAVVVDVGTAPMALAGWFQLENSRAGCVAAWVDTTAVGRGARAEAVTAGAAWISTEGGLERFLALASARAAGVDAPAASSQPPGPRTSDSLPPWSPAGIFAGAPVSLMILGSDRRFLYVNPMAAEIHGVRAADHAQRTLGEVLPGMEPSLEPLVDRVLATGRSVEGVEVVGVTPRSEGKPTRWRVTLFPVHRYGRLDAVGAVVFDAGSGPARARPSLASGVTPVQGRERLEPPRVLLVATDANATGVAYAALQSACRVSVVGRVDDAIDWLKAGQTCDAVVVDGVSGASNAGVDVVTALLEVAPALRGRIVFIPADGALDMRAVLEPPALEGELVDPRTLVGGAG